MAAYRRLRATARRPTRPVLIVMEGAHDITFLKRISRAIYSDAGEVPDLPALEAQGKVAFFHLAGEFTARAACRYSGFGFPEVHVYAWKSSEQSDRRKRVVDFLGQRPNCLAFLTRKRSFENYLHSEVVQTSDGERINIDDGMDVPSVLAETFVAGTGRIWKKQPGAFRRHIQGESRKWLCTVAAQAMTLDLLEDRDPAYELIDWLMAVRMLLDQTISKRDKRQQPSRPKPSRCT